VPVIMSLHLHFSFQAPTTASVDDLETFLKDVGGMQVPWASGLQPCSREHGRCQLGDDGLRSD